MPVTDFLNLRDHVIVITGAASGMGRAIAQAASREGARLVLSDFDGERLATTAGELKGEVRHLRADVTRLPEIDAVFALAEREFGGIDGLVTCAGIITTLPLLEVTPEEWDRVFAVNAKGTFFTVQAALRRMLPRGQGRIVTIGSDSYKLGGGRIANIPYAASKGAVVTMTKGFARTLVGTRHPDQLHQSGPLRHADARAADPGAARHGRQPHPPGSLRPSGGDRQRRPVPALRRGQLRVRRELQRRRRRADGVTDAPEARPDAVSSGR